MIPLRYFKISVTIYQLTTSNIPDDLTVQQNCYENLKSQKWSEAQNNIKFLTRIKLHDFSRNSTKTIWSPLSLSFEANIFNWTRFTLSNTMRESTSMVTHTVLHLEWGSSDLHECKKKGKVHLITGHKGPEVEKRYNSTLSLTSALDGGWEVNATPRTYMNVLPWNAWRLEEKPCKTLFRMENLVEIETKCLKWKTSI